jgi:hypothetical protein
MTDIIERLRAERPQFYESTMEEAAGVIERLRAEITDWHECAKFDVLMEGARAMGWDRSALERCREKYIR